MRSLLSLIPYLRPHRKTLVLGLVFVVGAAALATLAVRFLQAAIDGITQHAPASQIWTLAAAMIGIALIGGTLRYGMRECLNGASRWVEYDLRNALFGHLETLDATYFGRTRTGDIMARLTNDLSAVRMAAGPAIMYFVNTIAGGVFALVVMLRISPHLTGIALLPMLPLPLIVIRLGKTIHDRFEAVQEHFSTLTTHAQENLSGTRIVRAYRQERSELSRFSGLNDEYLRRNMRLVRLYGGMNPLFGLLAGLGAVTVLGFGGSLVLKGTITVGAFVAFGFLLAMLTWPLIALGWTINLFQRGAASMGRLNEIFAAQPLVVSPARARSLPPAHGGRSIEFRGVGFHYPTPALVGDTAPPTEPRWVLRDVSFEIPAGGTLGVVGTIGSGKSALLDLIPRLYDPQEGEILIDGIPIQSLDLRELRATIGAVPQESLLFSDTIAVNLAYGLPEDPDDPEGVAGGAAGTGNGAAPVGTHWAAHVAQLDATIADFPGGYDTMLGERGINLSGGQKQRAALARALARRPSIVLLDDALSAVDTHTEAEILQGLRNALSGRTAVIASHRASAIRDASWIIVLDAGRIVEQGRHEELLAAGGRYWSLLRRQQLVESIESDAA
jgi:ATP-binding cassette subfamily B multidrug efflux pump